MLKKKYRLISCVQFALQVEIPLGEVAHPARHIEVDHSSGENLWSMNEYIVPDESRVRIRYILELVNKTKE